MAGFTLPAALAGGTDAGASSAATPSTPAVTVLATYHSDLRRDGYSAHESIAQSQASGFHLLWSETTKNVISDEATVTGGIAYWGDWQGLEHATNSEGTDLWTQNLGTTVDSNCYPSSAGVASTATVGTVNGREVLWTGTGNGKVASLDASNGQVIWETRIAPKSGGFVWSSPAVYRGKVYIGISSFGDCPLVRGEVVELDAITGQVDHIFYTAQQGCVGAGVWSSPAVDPVTDSLYVTTGNSYCAGDLGSAIVRLSTASLALQGSWLIPSNQNTSDGDWGATPTLFTADLGGVSTPMVGGAAKNGVFYALKRSDLAAGPVWQVQVAQGGDDPQGGNGSISPAAFDGHNLYVAGGSNTVNGTSCSGVLLSLNPATGQSHWEDCLNGPVLSPVVVTPGLAYVTDGSQILCVSKASGSQVWTYTEPSGGVFYGGPVVTGSVLYAGNTDGTMSAFAAG